MIVDAVLDQMLRDGCTAVQIVNAIKADRAEQLRRRVERKCRKAIAAALFEQPVISAKMNEPSTVDGSLANEQFTPMQADAPTYGDRKSVV